MLVFHFKSSCYLHHHHSIHFLITIEEVLEFNKYLFNEANIPDKEMENN